MQKRKLAAVYFVLGILGLLLFNFPIVNLLKDKVWLGVPAVLIYFSGVVVLLSLLSYLVVRWTKDIE